MHYRGTNGALLESHEDFVVLPDHSLERSTSRKKHVPFPVFGRLLAYSTLCSIETQ
jgi:hypothetical protein